MVYYSYHMLHGSTFTKAALNEVVFFIGDAHVSPPCSRLLELSFNKLNMQNESFQMTEII